MFPVDGWQLLFTIDLGTLQNEEGCQLDARMHLLDLAGGTFTDLSSIRTDG